MYCARTHPRPGHRQRLAWRLRRGLTLVEVILAFTLLLLFVGGVVQVLSYQATTAMYATLQTHLLNQNRVLGHFLASYNGIYDPTDTQPIGTAGAAPQLTFPDNVLGWAGLRFLDGKSDIGSSAFEAGQALTMVCLEYDAEGRLVAPADLSTDVSVLGYASWEELSAKMGVPVNCDPLVNPTEARCISLVNEVKRANLFKTEWAQGLRWYARIGGRGDKTRVTPWGVRQVDGDGMQYEIRVFKEKVADTPMPGIRIRVWMGLSEDAPASRMFAGRPRLVVDTVYQKRH